VQDVGNERGPLAVIGAGTMGSGIAQAWAMAGFAVRLRDIGAAELALGQAAIETSLARFVKSGRLTEEAAREAQARIQTTTSLERAVAGADAVIEAVPEVLELKHEVLELAAEHAPQSALLATNTSQFSITGLGAPLGPGAERFVGMHFFNPPVMMRLVELVRGELTSDLTLARAVDLVAAFGKQSVVCRKDSPGFITTRAYAALRLECLRMLEEGLASAEDIDTALTLAFNLPMGPLELGDFNGLDISLHVLTALEDVFGERFRPTAGLRDMVAAGKLGRKAGVGFYRYSEDGVRLPNDDG
jgi:3-hydroxybutyryl-CoA dehydrogenase